MKNILYILCILLFIIFIFSCTESDGYCIPFAENVRFCPPVVKRGDVITITYYLKKGDPNLSCINDMTVDSDGIVRYIGNNEQHFIDFDDTKNFNGAVKFGGSFISEIYPKRYISYEWGEIKCYVPDDAVSGKICLAITNLLLSEKDLIVVDESGDEIW